MKEISSFWSQFFDPKVVQKQAIFSVTKFLSWVFAFAYETHPKNFCALVYEKNDVFVYFIAFSMVLSAMLLMYAFFEPVKLRGFGLSRSK